MRDFATCTGRFSAEVEHSWLMAAGEAERKEVLYGNMSALLSAVTGPEDEQRAMAIRIDAKAAHARLLLQSAFGWDADQRRVAERRADELLATCSALILADSDAGSMKIWAVTAD